MPTLSSPQLVIDAGVAAQQQDYQYTQQGAGDSSQRLLADGVLELAFDLAELHIVLHRRDGIAGGKRRRLAGGEDVDTDDLYLA